MKTLLNKIMLSLLTLQLMFAVAPRAALAGSELTPAQEQALLRDLAARDPEGYELYREDRADNAATYEEFLNWATPEEIADDLDLPDEEYTNLIQNASDAPPVVQINVSLSQHSLVMTSPDGKLQAGAMGGRPGHPTPRGCFTPTVLDRNHHSKKYNNAPMPNAVFFRGGAALHAGDLNVPSHGCVHLDLKISEAVYKTVSKYGRTQTQVCVQN